MSENYVRCGLNWPFTLLRGAFWFTILLLSLGLFFAAGTKTALAAEGETVEFFDSGSFDRSLSSALRKDAAAVTIKFPAPITVNSIPERLDKWFSMVEKHEGTVKVEADPDIETSRGLFTEIISLVVGAYEIIKGKIIYEPVKDYNAIIYYDPRGGGKVTRVIFTRK